MNQTKNSHLKPTAQAFRRTMTKEERHLWYDFLKSLPVTVNRQKVIGKYIADFYCASEKLIIEIDGTQHFEKSGMEHDQTRDAFFSGLGISVLRYSNADINDHFNSVCEDILRHMKAASP